MYMKKNSPFTPFVSNAIMKLAETGVKNNLSKRHVISEPNCKPIRTKGRPLGMHFFLSVFVAYFICCIICLIIFVLEHVFKPEISRKVQKPRLEVLKKEFDEKIKDLVKDIECKDMDTILLRRRTITLIAEMKTLIE